MRKLVIVLVVLAVVVGAVLFALANFNSYLHDNRQWLADEASAALGRPVEFDDIGVSFRGGFGAALKNFSIADDPAYSKGNFVEVGEANVVVKILPALRGRYEVERVVLVAPRVNIVRRKSGFNFETFGAKAGAEADRPAPAAPASTAASGASDEAAVAPGEGLPLVVSLLEIRQGRFRLVDETTSPASEVVVDRVDFSAADIGFDAPVTVELAAAVLGVAQQNVHLSGSVGPLVSPADASRAPLNLDLEIGPLVVDRAKKLPTVGEAIPAELSSPDPITLRVAVAGRLDAPQAAVSLDATDAALSFGDVFRKPRGTRLSLQAKGVASPDVIDISGLVFSLAEATFRGGGRIATGAAKDVDVQISGKGIPLGGWGKLLPVAEGLDVGGIVNVDLRARQRGSSGIPELHGTIGLDNVRAVQPGGGVEISGLTTEIAIDGDRVEIPQTRFLVAGESVTASATVTSVKSLSGDFAVSAAELDLAALGAGAAGLERAEVVRDLALEGSFAQAKGGPRFSARLRSSAGSVRDVEYSSLTADFGMAHHRADLERLSLGAFGGLLSGNAVYDMSQQPSHFSFRGKLDGLDVARIVDYLDIGATVKMTGKVHGDLNLQGSGTEQEQIAQSVVGDGFLRVDDGVIADLNIAESVFTSVTGIPGLSALISPGVRKRYPEIFEAGDTKFEELGGVVDLRDGRAYLHDLALVANDYRVDGAGTVGFDKKVDIEASFAASEVLTGDLLGSFKEVKYLLGQTGRFEIPIEFVGTLPDVSPRPDLDFITERLSGALVSEGLEKGLDALFGKSKKKRAHPGGDGGSGGKGGKGAVPNQTEETGHGTKPAAQPNAERILMQGLGNLLGGGKKHGD